METLVQVVTVALAVVAIIWHQQRTDRTSWALMERLSIADALSLDADFRVYRYGPQRRGAFAVRPLEGARL